jgi:uncharacterized protein YktB (UPF0637 family)
VADAEPARRGNSNAVTSGLIISVAAKRHNRHKESFALRLFAAMVFVDFAIITAKRQKPKGLATDGHR